MSVSKLFLAIFLILLGVSGVGMIAVPSFWIGIFALFSGVLMFIELFVPLTIPLHRGASTVQ